MIAESYCDIFVLTQKALDRVLKIFPEQREVVERVAKTRLSEDRVRELISKVPQFRDCGQSFIKKLAICVKVIVWEA